MSFLPIIIGIVDGQNQRVDPKRTDGTRGPIMLQIGEGVLAEAVVDGGLTLVRLRALRALVEGPALINANATLAVADGTARTLPAGTLSANRTITLGVSGAVEGQAQRVRLFDAGPYTVSVVNGGPSGGTLFIKPAGVPAWVDAWFDGTDWQLDTAQEYP